MSQSHLHTCSRLFVLAIPVLVLAACSIIEERFACPCRLEFLVDGSFMTENGVDIIVRGTQGHFAFHRHYDAWEASMPITVDVADREGADILVCPGFMSGFIGHDGSLVFPTGSSCPEMMLYPASVITTPESISIEVAAHKNHCNITVRFSDSFPANCLLQLSSSFCGMAPGGRVVEGVLKQEVPLGTGGCAQCRLPRQGDYSAMLDIITPEGTARHIALGSMMQQAGYDWTAEDLDDVSLDIDYALCLVRLEFSGWEEEIFLPIVI